LAKKRYTAAASLMDDGEVAAEASEESDDDHWSESDNRRSRVFLHAAWAGYDIELIDRDGLMQAMSQVKWPTPNPSGLATVDLRNGPAVELLQAMVHNLPTFIAIEPLLLFLKDTYHGGGLGSSAAMSDIIDDVHEKGSFPGSPKMKETIFDSRECTL
jgi:hypothetical protein